MEFQQKIIERSGLGDSTGLSDGKQNAQFSCLSSNFLSTLQLCLLNRRHAAGILAMEHGPLKTSMQSAMAETEEVIYSVVEGLLQKTQIHPREVGIHFPLKAIVMLLFF